MNAHELASYICQRQFRVLYSSFDRNASHNAGEYKEYTYISIDALQEVITEFLEDNEDISNPGHTM